MIHNNIYSLVFLSALDFTIASASPSDVIAWYACIWTMPKLKIQAAATECTIMLIVCVAIKSKNENYVL